MSARTLIGPYWQLLRTRCGRVTARIEDVALAARGREALVGEVRALRGRLAELERDHLLLAAHVATLTEQRAASDTTLDDGGARQRARLAAIAGYEQRIGALEERLRQPWARRWMSIGRTSDERGDRAS